MAHHNPNITENEFCVLAMKSKNGNFSEGFTVVGPFPTEDGATDWAKEFIVGTEDDNPHWVVAPMTNVLC